MPSYWLNTELCRYLISAALYSMAASGGETASTSSAKDHTHLNDSGSSRLAKAILPNPIQDETDKEKPIVGHAHTEESQVVEIIALTDLWRKIGRGNKLAASMIRDIYMKEK